MVTQDQIQSFANEIAARYSPEKIILFGSYARGTATPDSDVDLLVIMRYVGRPAHMAAEIAWSIKPPFSTDILVRDQQQVNTELHAHDCFFQEVVREGRCLYEAKDTQVA